MQNELHDIVIKYFNPTLVESAKLFKGRAIITLKAEANDLEQEKALEAELKNMPEVEKVSIIYTGTKAEPKQGWPINGVKNIIAVASGKGGVGKSTTAVNLSLALANQGLKIALVDADIYGPSIPTLIGLEDVPPVTMDGKTFEPFSHLGIKSISIGSLIDKTQPLIWRGIKASQALEQLLTQTNWGEIDLMVLDMPPGTGDIQLSLAQNVQIKGAVIVSTPQDVALIDAIKGVNMFNMVNVPIIGIIENMSYYICETCGTKADIFGTGGAEATAQKLGINFLGAIPLHINIRKNSDEGTPIVMSEPESEYTKSYENIAKKIIELLK